nr:cysteine-rich receptor-like protein kinase [Tanacetum cinerariifolium]
MTPLSCKASCGLPNTQIGWFQPSGGYHAVPPPYTGTFMPPKLDLVFHTAPIPVEMTTLPLMCSLVLLSLNKTCLIHLDLVHLSLKTGHSVQLIKTTFQAATSVPATPKSNSSGERRNKNACFICKSMDHLIKDRDYHFNKMSQTTPRNYANRGHYKQYVPLTQSKPQKHRVPTADVDNFNYFIDNSDLIDLPLGGRIFTWMDKDGTKLNRNPILLHVSKSDFGPTPFKLFHSWLLRDSFNKVIKMELPKLEEHNFVWKLLSHKKFRLLKARIKQWHSETKTFDRVTKHDNLQLIKSIDDKIKAGSANDNDRDSHEVQNAVWDCGSFKVPDPDGFSFAFVKKYWDDIKVSILEYVIIFLDTGSLPHGSNSSFFSLIPKVINPIFIKDFCPISLIGVHYKITANRLAKVDFEKAFDLVIWKYLDFVLFNLGFGSKWRYWIRACLSSSRASILVNGSPTLEFYIKHGIRKGDPLSSFLFILVMKRLHNALSTVGIGVSDVDVSSMASNSGCASGSFPFTYFGLPIGSNMSLTSSWKVLLERSRAMFFSRGSYEDRKLAWVKWKNAISYYDNGDLNIGSLKAFNIDLLQKWRWRLLSHKNALWVKVIKLYMDLFLSESGKSEEYLKYICVLAFIGTKDREGLLGEGKRD